MKRSMISFSFVIIALFFMKSKKKNKNIIDFSVIFAKTSLFMARPMKNIAAEILFSV
jgi:hypothetical protein